MNITIIIIMAIIALIAVAVCMYKWLQEDSSLKMHRAQYMDGVYHRVLGEDYNTIMDAQNTKLPY